MHNANFLILEKVTNTKVFTSKAYAADLDLRTRQPNKNMKYVAKQETKKRKYKYVLLQCPSVHISNMNTESADNDNMKEMKKEVSESAAKMIEVAENLVKVKPSIEKVVLVDCIPRFDHESSHRCGLKSKLARYSNDVQRQIASESEFNDKMIIGNHSMNGNTETYGDKNLPYFDGIHMNGRKGTETYTKS